MLYFDILVQIYFWFPGSIPTSKQGLFLLLHLFVWIYYLSVLHQSKLLNTFAVILNCTFITLLNHYMLRDRWVWCHGFSFYCVHSHELADMSTGRIHWIRCSYMVNYMRPTDLLCIQFSVVHSESTVGRLRNTQLLQFIIWYDNYFKFHATYSRVSGSLTQY